MNSDWQSWAALGVVVITAVVFSLRMRKAKGKAGCGSGCGCSGGAQKPGQLGLDAHSPIQPQERPVR